jgi:hypothetical protein
MIRFSMKPIAIISENVVVTSYFPQSNILSKGVAMNPAPSHREVSLEQSSIHTFAQGKAPSRQGCPGHAIVQEV